MQSVKSKFSTELKVWDKLRIIVGEDRQAGHYDTRVEELINGGVVVSDPVFIFGHTLLRNHVPVIVQLTRTDAAYQFHSRVRVSGEGSVRRVILTPPRRFQRVQRRMFARVELHNRVSYSRVPDGFDWQDWDKSLSWHQSRAANISAGGILLEMREPVRTNDLLVLKIDLLAEFELPSTLPARVRRVFSSEEKRYAGVEYVLTEHLEDNFPKRTIGRLPEQLKSFGYHQQDRLVSVLFHKQIELRQKGLI